MNRKNKRNYFPTQVNTSTILLKNQKKKKQKLVHIKTKRKLKQLNNFKRL